MSIPMLSQTGQVWPLSPDPSSIMISGQGFLRYVGSAEPLHQGRRQWERPVRARSVSDSVALIIDQRRLASRAAPCFPPAIYDSISENVIA